MAAKAEVFHGDHGAAPPARRLEAANASHAFQPSPALMLQDSLSCELNAGEAGPKWPALATLAFMAVTCGVFWTAVALGVSRAF